MCKSNKFLVLLFIIIFSSTTVTVNAQYAHTNNTHAQLSVYNALGKLIANQTVTLENGSLNATLPLDNWQQGMYVVKLTTSVQVLTTKLIINQ